MPVYNPKQEEKKDAQLYANNVRDAIAKKLNLPTTNHSFEDCRLMVRSRKRKFPMETGLIEYDEIKAKFKLVVFFLFKKIEFNR